MKHLFTLLVTCISFTFAQSLNFPCTRGGVNDGGTIISYGLDNDHTRSITFKGNPEALDRYSSGAQGRPGLVYVANKNAIYGVFSEGGSAVNRVQSWGTIYKFDVTTEEFTIIRYFSDYDESEGKLPVGEMVYDAAANRLYGVCAKGGLNNAGLIYYIDLTDDSYHVLYRLNATTDGSNPKTRLVQTNDLLVGMCSNQPNTSGGTCIFTYNLTNNQYDVTFQSTDSPTFSSTDIMVDNNHVYFIRFTDISRHTIGGSLNNSITYFHGLGNIGVGVYPIAFHYHNGLGKNMVVFAKGGSNGHGSLAMFSPGNGVGLTNVHNFSGDYAPELGLTNGNLGVSYGILESTSGGGSILYSFDGSGIYTELHNFVNQGAILRVPPVFVNGKLYGVAEFGGANKSGVFYRIDSDGNNYQNITDLGYPQGRGPNTRLTSIGNNEYLGITGRGARWGSGGMFKVDLNIGTLTDVKVLPDTAFVQDMRGEIFLHNNNFYSVTVAAQGVIENEKAAYMLYGVDTSSGYLAPIIPIYPHQGTFNKDSVYKSIISSNYIQENNIIYGTTFGGLFQLDLSDSSFQSLHRFEDTTLQGFETGNIIKDGSLIFGVNYRGGTNNAGTLWQYNTTNGQFNILKQFTNEKPNCLTKKGDSIYVFHEQGGSNGYGGIALVNAISTVQSQALDFDSLTTGFITTGSPLLAPNGQIYLLNTYGAANAKGGILAFDPSDNSYELKLSFTEATGYNPINAPIIWRDQLNVSTAEQFITQFKAYPNPTSAYIQLEANADLEQIEIYNLNGQKVFRANYKNIKNTTIDINHLLNGHYLLKCTFHGGASQSIHITKE